MAGYEEDSSLGKEVSYQFNYDPSVLFPIPRQQGRSRIGLALDEALPFVGVDIWTGFEISWLNSKGKPEVRIAEFFIPCTSQFLVESKSFKLYLNTFNQTRFDSEADVLKAMINDLSKVTESDVNVSLHAVDARQFLSSGEEALCIDGLDVEIEDYAPNDQLLEVDSTQQVSETLMSHLLRSNCPVTGQPDWGTVVIKYSGNKLNHEALLKYLISFRQHTGFHEQCVEEIYLDLMKVTEPNSLEVYARYLRRGGLDINPYRAMNAFSADVSLPKFRRLARQ
jgi:7-cyano-7-deazaguanine reductase